MRRAPTPPVPLSTLAVACLAALALAGCSSTPDGPLPAVPGETWVALEPVVLAEGTFQWHETGSANPATAMEYYDLASQAVAHPCIYDRSTGEEVYFNNLKLPMEPGLQWLGPWPGNLTISVDWTDMDWTGSALRAAYQAPGVHGLRETLPIERGSSLTVPIRVAQAAEDEDGGDGDEAAVPDWSVWLCLPTNTGEVEQPFVGSVQAKAVFAPDPVPESSLAQETEADGNRTARG